MTGYESALMAVSQMLVFVICSVIFLRRRGEDFSGSLYFLLIGVSFFVFGFSSLMEYMGMGTVRQEYSILHALFWSVILSVVVSNSSGMLKMKYLTFLTLLSGFVFFLVAGRQFLQVMEFLSYYMAAMSFFTLYMFSSKAGRSSGLAGLFAVFLLTFFSLLDLPGAFAANFLLAASFGLYLIRGPWRRGQAAAPGNGRGSVWKPFAYMLSYLILMNIAVFSAGIALHEAGHLAIGSAMGCVDGKIVLLQMISGVQTGPYTELSCPGAVEGMFLALSGFPFVTLFGLVFLFLKAPERNFGFVILGSSIVLGGSDLATAFESTLLIGAMALIGVLTIAFGEIMLINGFMRPADK